MDIRLHTFLEKDIIAVNETKYTMTGGFDSMGSIVLKSMNAESNTEYIIWADINQLAKVFGKIQERRIKSSRLSIGLEKSARYINIISERQKEDKIYHELKSPSFPPSIEAVPFGNFGSRIRQGSKILIKATLTQFGRINLVSEDYGFTYDLHADGIFVLD